MESDICPGTFASPVSILKKKPINKSESENIPNIFVNHYFRTTPHQNIILTYKYSSLSSELSSKCKDRRYHIVTNERILKILTTHITFLTLSQNLCSHFDSLFHF